MNDFPKYPTDFVAMASEFTEQDIEKFINQKNDDVIHTIDMLKRREVNASNSLINLRKKINDTIISKEKELKKIPESRRPLYKYSLEKEILILKKLL